MELYACGFNAHDQLGFRTHGFNQVPGPGSSPYNQEDEASRAGAPRVPIQPRDRYVLERVCCTAGKIKILYAGWSQTLLQLDNELHIFGRDCTLRDTPITLPANRHVLWTPEDVKHERISSAFGDYDGVKGVVNKNGDVYLIHFSGAQYAPELIRQQTRSGAGIFQIAIAGNGHATAVLADRTTVVEYNSLADLLTFINTSALDPFATYSLPAHHMAVCLTASSKTFSLLTARGTIYTWSTTGLPSNLLARDPTNISTPMPIDDLDGLLISKIATSGTLAGALAADQELYIWGTPASGSWSKRERIADLPTPFLHPDDPLVGLAKILHPSRDGEEDEEGIADFGVGHKHLVALTTRGRLFGAGGNENGQLGLGKDVKWTSEWTEIKIGDLSHTRQAVSVHCGPQSTFVVVGDKYFNFEAEETKGGLVKGKPGRCGGLLPTCRRWERSLERARTL